MLNDVLGEAFSTTDAELTANATGRLTPAQLDRIHAEYPHRWGCASGILVGFLAPVVVLVVASLVADASSGFWRFVIIASGVYLALGAAAVLIAFRYSITNRVFRADGEVEHVVMPAGIATDWIHVDGIDIELHDDSQKLAFAPGEEYRVFFVERTHREVAVSAQLLVDEACAAPLRREVRWANRLVALAAAVVIVVVALVVASTV